MYLILWIENQSYFALAAQRFHQEHICLTIVRTLNARFISVHGPIRPNGWSVAPAMNDYYQKLIGLVGGVCIHNTFVNMYMCEWVPTVHRRPRYIHIPVAGVFILSEGNVDLVWSPVLRLVL